MKYLFVSVIVVTIDRFVINKQKQRFALIYLFNSYSVAGGSRRKKGRTIRRSHDTTSAALSPSIRKEGGGNGCAKAEKGTDRIQ